METMTVAEYCNDFGVFDKYMAFAELPNDCGECKIVGAPRRNAFLEDYPNTTPVVIKISIGLESFQAWTVLPSDSTVRVVLDPQ